MARRRASSTRRQVSRQVAAAAAALLLLLAAAAAAQDASPAPQDPPVPGSDAPDAADAEDEGPDAASDPLEAPPCCGALAPVLPLLNASSVAALQLPVMIFSTQGDNLTASKNRVHGLACVCGVPGGFNYEWMPVKAGVRGSTSVRDFARKSLALTTHGSKRRLLGMPKGKKWFLYAPEGDVALLRNDLAYSLWRQTGRWGPRTAWAELFIVPSNTTALGAQHYQGLYMAGEKIWRGKHRINVDKYSAARDITGGFIFRLEHGKPKDVPSFATRLTGLLVLLQQPRRNVSDASLAYLTRYFDAFERQLLRPGLGNYSAYVAPDSLVDWFLASEVVKSANDGYRGSVYLWKDSASAAAAAAAADGNATDGNATSREAFDTDGLRTSQVDGRVVMGPIWDAAKGLGLCCGFPVEGYQAGGASSGISGGSAISPNGWLFNVCSERSRCRIDPVNGLAQWYLALWPDPGFQAAMRARWRELRAGAWSDAWLGQAVDGQARAITPAALRSFNRWASTYAQDKIQLPPPGLADYPAALAAAIADLRQWVLARVRWLDSQLLTAPGAQPATAALGTNLTTASSPPLPASTQQQLAVSG